jgi:serine/threonine protein kinase
MILTNDEKNYVIKKKKSLEIEILNKLNHPNILKIDNFIFKSEYQVFQCELLYKNKIKNVKDFIKKTKELINAIKYLHENKIIHRDIKDSNIMVNKNNSIILIDFDLSVDLLKNSEDLKYKVGTKYFIAPESYQHFYSDIYSLGKVLENWSEGLDFKQNSLNLQKLIINLTHSNFERRINIKEVCLFFNNNFK